MANFDDYKQKAKGKFQQVKGDFKSSTGDGVGSTWDKMKGTVNEGIADMKMKNRDGEDDGIEEEK